MTQPYSALPPEALLGNSLGVLIVAFGLVVLKILSTREWQRPDSRPEDMAYTVRISVWLTRSGGDKGIKFNKAFSLKKSISASFHSLCFKKKMNEGELQSWSLNYCKISSAVTSGQNISVLSVEAAACSV